MGEQLEEDAEAVAARRAALAKQERGIQRADVAVVHIAGEAFEEQIGVAALEGARRLGGGQGVARAQIFAQQQGLDLGGGAPHTDRLQGQGQQLALREVGAEQDRGDGGGLADVVRRIAQEGGVVLAEGPGDVAAFDVGAVRRGHAEMARHRLERMVFQRPVRHVVGQRQQIGVHDLPSVQMVAVVGHRALGGREARSVRFRPAAVAAERQRHPVALRAGLEVGQVELEQVVSRHHVRIAFADGRHELLEQRLFIEVPAVENLFPALAVGQGDGQDAVLLAVGVGEFMIGAAVCFKVEEQKLEIGQEQVAERGAARVEQELLDGVAKDEIGRAGIGRGTAGRLAQVAKGALQRRPRREPSQRPEGIFARQALDFGHRFEPVKIIRLGQPEKRRKRLRARGQFARAAQEQRHGVRRLAGGMLDGDQSRFRREPVHQFIAAEGFHHGKSIVNNETREKHERTAKPYLSQRARRPPRNPGRALASWRPRRAWRDICSGIEGSGGQLIHLPRSGRRQPWARR